MNFDKILYKEILTRYFKKIKPTKQDLEKLMKASTFTQDFDKYSDFAVLYTFYDLYF